MLQDGGDCPKVNEIGMVPVFEKSNDSCQGSWLKDGEEGSKTQGGFEGYSQDRAVKKRDEVDACRFSFLLSFFLSYISLFRYSRDDAQVCRRSMLQEYSLLHR